MREREGKGVHRNVWFKWGSYVRWSRILRHLCWEFPIGMKRKYIFYNLPYWENLKITLLLDPMHIFKKFSSSLWRNISSKKSDTLAVRKYLITSKTKKKHWPRRLESTGAEAGVGPSNSWYFKEGDVPWILKIYYISLAKEFIMGVRVPYSYGSSLRRCFTVEDHFSGLKSHDHLNLLTIHKSKKLLYNFYFIFMQWNIL